MRQFLRPCKSCVLVTRGELSCRWVVCLDSCCWLVIIPSSSYYHYHYDDSSLISERRLYCLCKKRASESVEGMIACDTCDDWFHFACVKLSPNAGTILESYMCPVCCEERGLSYAPGSAAVQQPGMTATMVMMTKTTTTTDEGITMAERGQVGGMDGFAGHATFAVDALADDDDEERIRRMAPTTMATMETTSTLQHVRDAEMTIHLANSLLDVADGHLQSIASSVPPATSIHANLSFATSSNTTIPSTNAVLTSTDAGSAPSRCW